VSETPAEAAPAGGAPAAVPRPGDDRTPGPAADAAAPAGIAALQGAAATHGAPPAHVDQPTSEPAGDPACPPEPGAPPPPAPLGVDRAPTGNPEVDAAAQRLADADELPTEDHIEVYEDVHTALRDILSALDRPAGPRPPQPRAPLQNRS
jgi:hypothetical protein